MSDEATPVRIAHNATARYIAPVSTYKYPSLAAIRRASVLFPAPAGPSMATVMRLLKLS